MSSATKQTVVALKKDFFYASTPQFKVARGLILVSEFFNRAALSLRAGRQGNLVRAAESSADVSVVFSQTEKEKRWPSDNRQLSIRWCTHTEESNEQSRR